MDFKKFKEAVAKQFEKMSQHDLFETKVTKDAALSEASLADLEQMLAGM